MSAPFKTAPRQARMTASPREFDMASRLQGAIDCDVHPNVPGMRR